MRLLILLLITISSHGLFAQSQSSNPENSLQNISISQWTTDHGMPSNNATQVFQDSNGLIWIASFNGFMIYDGERIDIYDKNNVDFLETDGFYSIVEDQSGVIYLGGQGSGITQYKNGTFFPYLPKGIEVPKSIRSLFISSDETLYVGTNNNGLYKVKNDSVTKIDHEILAKVTVREIAEDSNGRIWIGTEGNGLFGMNESEIIHHSLDNGLLSNNVISLAIHDGSLFIGTSRGLQSLDEALALSTYSELSNNYINSLMIDERGLFWIGSERGIARWNPTTRHIEWLKTKKNVDLVRISSMIQDNENNIWLTSNRSGLIQIKKSKVLNITQPNISSDRIYIVHESWDGKLYIGTDQDKIDVLENGVYNQIVLKTDLGGNGVRDIYHDTDGSLWLATYRGIIHIQNGVEKVYSIETGMPANNFRTVLKDKKGNFWFGSRSGGLVKFRDGKILDVFGNGHGLESNFILSVTEANNGDLYIGTHSGGLTIIDTQGTFHTYHLKQDDSGLLLFNIDLDSSNRALITANIGPLWFDGDSLTQINLQSDLRSKTYFDMVIDDNDHLWITTNLGILQIKKSDWVKYQNKEIAELSYVVIDENSGMNSQECTGATRSTKSSTGHLYVPTLGGIVVIDPNIFETNSLVPDIKIRNMTADDQNINVLTNGIEIPPGTSRYKFEFCVISYNAPDQNQFKYMLKGFDKEWSPSGYLGSVEYTNLPPGKYELKVIGSNDNQVWNKKGDTFSFTVLPFFHETIWFYILIFSVISIGIFIFYKWRISFIDRQNIELRKVNAELDRFVYSASHEMRSPLSSILGLINVARLDEKADITEYLGYIESSVQRLDAFIQDIIDYSRNARLELKVEAIDLKSKILDILKDISFTDNYSKIEHFIECNGNQPFHSDSKRLKIVLSNIITNAYKHHAPDETKEPFVKINIQSSKLGVKIRITDNGPGIGKEHQENIFKMFYRATNRTQGSGLGLYIVKEIVENLKGSIKIKSKINKGTTFTIKLPDLSITQ